MSNRSPLSLLSTAAALLVRAGIAVYRVVVSPALGPTCRFEPSCSAYADQAIAKYGVWRGGRMAAGRLVRCHPFDPGGSDPVR